MHYGVIVPDMGDADIGDVVALAAEAEAAGWDALFFWDGDWAFSPWVAMTAMAQTTERVRIGAILHPLGWRQPWLFARDTATLDRLSNGRLVISIGMGAVEEADFERGRTRFGTPVDRRERAELIDEGLEITNGLWSGEPVTFRGKHYQLDSFALKVRPRQSPRIPIWAVGVWGKRKSMERVLRCDGMLTAEATSRDEIRAIRAFVAEHRTLTSPFDIVMEADTRENTAEEVANKLRTAADAGVTWWVESMWTPGVTVASATARVRQGPPGA